jgi:hypothetical protein
MKQAKSVMILVAVLVVSTTTLVFAMRQLGSTAICPYCRQSPQIDRERPSPDNATIIPDIEAVTFGLSTPISDITIPRGTSSNLIVMLHSLKRVELLLWVEMADAPSLDMQPPTLPAGIDITLNMTEVSLESDSDTILNVAILIENDAEAGIYDLMIAAIQRTSYGSATVRIPLRLTVP